MANKSVKTGSSFSSAKSVAVDNASAAIPNTPTIGTATATSDVAATVTYTAAVLGATASTFTATSSPGSITGTGSSPITVTGLTASTAYTFTVTAGNANGTSSASSASNSITTSAALGSFESIATVTVGSGGSSYVEFTSIPSTFKHLQIRAINRSSRSDYSDGPIFRLGTGGSIDTGSNYSVHFLKGSGSSVTANGGANTSGLGLGDNPAASQTSGVFGIFIIDILDYANTNKNKTTRSINCYDANDSGRAEIRYFSGNWRNAGAIDTIRIYNEFGNFVQHSHFALYGIKGA